jgi:hypothetical protein
MLPSIGYASAAQPAAADRASNSNATRNDSQSKDNPDNSFDQVFSSAVSAGDKQPDRAPQDKAQSGGGETASDETVIQQAVAKASDPAPSAAKQPDAPPMDTSATATADIPAGVPAAELVNRPQPAQAASIEPVRRPRNSTPAARPRAEQAAGLPRLPLDPSSLSSLTMLLGTGVARIATPVAQSAAAAKAPETVGSDEEAQPVTGLTPQTPQNATAPDAGLAFALRLSREPAVAPENDSSSNAGAGPSVSSFANELEAAAGRAVSEEKVRPAQDNSGGIPPALANANVAVAAASNRTAEPEAAPNVTAAPAAELPSPTSAPVRAVRVQLAAEGNQRVDLTLVERAGALSVSVRSADSNLARSLQDHLPDLSARLGEQRYQTETWTPRLELPSMELPSASAGSAWSGESGSRNFESGGQKHGGQNGNSNPEQQQGRRERETPAWFEELTAFGRTPQIRSEYLWVQ